MSQKIDDIAILLAAFGVAAIPTAFAIVLIVEAFK